MLLQTGDFLPATHQIGYLVLIEDNKYVLFLNQRKHAQIYPVYQIRRYIFMKRERERPDKGKEFTQPNKNQDHESQQLIIIKFEQKK
jgi:hypothetical protein